MRINLPVTERKSILSEKSSATDLKRKADELSLAFDRIAAEAQATASSRTNLIKLAAKLRDLIRRFQG